VPATAKQQLKRKRKEGGRDGADQSNIVAALGNSTMLIKKLLHIQNCCSCRLNDTPEQGMTRSKCNISKRSDS